LLVGIVVCAASDETREAAHSPHRRTRTKIFSCVVLQAVSGSEHSFCLE